MCAAQREDTADVSQLLLGAFSLSIVCEGSQVIQNVFIQGGSDERTLDLVSDT